MVDHNLRQGGGGEGLVGLVKDKVVGGGGGRERFGGGIYSRVRGDLSER